MNSLQKGVFNQCKYAPGQSDCRQVTVEFTRNGKSVKNPPKQNIKDKKYNMKSTDSG